MPLILCCRPRFVIAAEIPDSRLRMSGAPGYSKTILSPPAGAFMKQKLLEVGAADGRVREILLSGDEFLIVIPQVSGRENASRIAAKLIAAVAGEFVLGKDRVRITASIGISVFPEDARERESLMKCADLALYQAKRAGRNIAQFYRPEMRGGTSA